MTAGAECPKRRPEEPLGPRPRGWTLYSDTPRGVSRPGSIAISSSARASHPSVRTSTVSAPRSRPAWRTVPGVLREPGEQARASGPRRPRRSRRAPRCGVGEQVGHRVDRRDRGLGLLERGEHLARRPGPDPVGDDRRPAPSRCSTRPSNVAKRGSSPTPSSSITRAAIDSADVEIAIHVPVGALVGAARHGVRDAAARAAAAGSRGARSHSAARPSAAASSRAG